MREALANIKGVRAAFTGTFERFGHKPAYRGPALTTILLVNVRGTQDELVTDHLWFNLTAEFAKLGLRRGDRISFEARSSPYEKGYRGRRDDDEFDPRPPPSTDYRLSHPTKAKVIEHGPAAPTSDEHLCHARGCTVPVPPKLLMCSVHWSFVPKPIQQAVWDNYREGQEVDKDPSPEWVRAADAAIAAVARKEGQGLTNDEVTSLELFK